MAESYKKINYTIRPAKNIERKMLAEALRKLDAFEPLTRYRYVGFGSTYFSDFALFHRSLGIRQMISIEESKSDHSRFKNNRPFMCIEVRFGNSTSVLPQIPWNLRTILWLDYEHGLDHSVLADVSEFCSKALSGSALVVTVNARPHKYDPSQNSPTRVAVLRDHVGDARVPPRIAEHDLVGSGTAAVYRTIMVNEILQALGTRNPLLKRPERLAFFQKFNFRYSDSSEMMTFGGLLVSGQEAATHLRSGMDRAHCDFVRDGRGAYVIDPPKLTLRELHYLDERLPFDGHRRVRTWVPAAERDRYARVYRYFPRFVEAEL